MADYQSQVVFEWHEKLLAEQTASINSAMDTTPQIGGQSVEGQSRAVSNQGSQIIDHTRSPYRGPTAPRISRGGRHSSYQSPHRGQGAIGVRTR